MLGATGAGDSRAFSFHPLLIQRPLSRWLSITTSMASIKCLLAHIISASSSLIEGRQLRITGRVWGHIWRLRFRKGNFYLVEKSLLAIASQKVNRDRKMLLEVTRENFTPPPHPPLPSPTSPSSPDDIYTYIHTPVYIHLYTYTSCIHIPVYIHLVSKLTDVLTKGGAGENAITYWAFVEPLTIHSIHPCIHSFINLLNNCCAI